MERQRKPSATIAVRSINTSSYNLRELKLISAEEYIQIEKIMENAIHRIITKTRIL